jgi:hypothetical protein
VRLSEEQRQAVEQAREGLVTTVRQVERELEGKIGQVRTLLDEVKEVKKRTDAKLIEHEAEIAALKEAQT